MKIKLKIYVSSAVIVLLFSACNWNPRRKSVQYPVQPAEQQRPTDSRKKIIILSSTGGGGHTSASEALVSYLSPEYHVEVVQIFRDVLGEFDPLNYWSSGRFSGEDLYNFFMTEGMFWGGSLCCTVGKRSWVRWHSQKMRERLEHFFLESEPDLVISVVPVINGLVYDAIEKLQIRGILMTLDPDASHFVCGLDQPDYEHFYCTMPCGDESVSQAIAYADIPPQRMRVVGFPVRKAFLEPRDREEVRQELNIPIDRPVVMVLMGAAGARSVMGYARKLSRVNLPLHIIFCVGRNELLKHKIEALSFPDNISISCFGFTNRIADLMHASDILITKSGAASVFEALYAQVPLLLDHTSNLISWEYGTVDFVCRHKFGEEINSLHQLPIILRKYLMKPELLNEMRARIQAYHLPDPQREITRLVREVLVDN
jgi:processive 1,2-diacylglycerol beta-glucosyltransferase